MLSVYLVNKALFRPATLLYMQISINITGMADMMFVTQK